MTAVDNEPFIFEVFVDLSSSSGGNSWLLARPHLTFESAHGSQPIFLCSIHASPFEHESTKSAQSRFFGLTEEALVASIVIREAIIFSVTISIAVDVLQSTAGRAFDLRLGVSRFASLNMKRLTGSPYGHLFSRRHIGNVRRLGLEVHIHLDRSERKEYLLILDFV